MLVEMNITMFLAKFSQLLFDTLVAFLQFSFLR